MVKMALLAPMLLAVVVGGLISMQGAANAYLAKNIGHPMWATLVSLLISTILMIPLLWWFKVPVPNFQTAFYIPWWSWLGGLLGAIGLTLTAMLVPKLGAAMYMVLVIIGQIAVSMLLDHFGLFGLEPKAVNVYKFIGIILLLLGVGMIYLGSLAEQAQ